MRNYSEVESLPTSLCEDVPSVKELVASLRKLTGGAVVSPDKAARMRQFLALVDDLIEDATEKPRVRTLLWKVSFREHREYTVLRLVEQCSTGNPISAFCYLARDVNTQHLRTATKNLAFLLASTNEWQYFSLAESSDADNTTCYQRVDNVQED